MGSGTMCKTLGAVTKWNKQIDADCVIPVQILRSILGFDTQQLLFLCS